MKYHFEGVSYMYKKAFGLVAADDAQRSGIRYSVQDFVMEHLVQGPALTP